MSLKKKRIGELEGSPLVIGDNNLVNDFETLVEMNADNTIKDIKKRKGDQFHTVINNETINSQVDLLNDLTEDGDFGAEVLKASASVTDDELISLFGDVDALDGMSRRNALTKQVSKAYSIAGTSKTLDFSKLLAIGNGEKVYSAICQIEDGNIIGDDTYTPAMLGLQTFDNTNIVLVVFDTTNNSIKIMNLPEVYEEDTSLSDIGITLDQSIKGYCYPTCATDGTNVYGKSFGTFTIKTRSV